MHTGRLGFCDDKWQIACAGEATSPVLLCLTGTPWVPLQQQLHLEQSWHSSSLALGTGHGTVMTDSLINWVDILTVMNALKSD